jgi:eukaryotic-like serine/threonine-protein kinase
MPLTAGTRLGPYEIVAPLGAGGMGEVYRARDARLARDVAIKALPAGFAQDPERLARFEREARLLASLSHPGIAGIHGLELVGDHRYLVLEFVEGETLAARLARGPLPVDEALHVCAQVAGAIEAAHEAGVIHRDLKPGNVMLKPDGGVKVLDFGLAKAGAAGGGSSSDVNLSASPTMTHAATSAGMILGTAAYMSPEQARGKAVDRRTDIWSFGCVLYECLTARQAFSGETVSDVIASILQTEPEWSALPAATPPRVLELLRRCLTRDVTMRLRDIGEARIALLRAPEPVATAAAPAHGVRAWLPWALAAAALAIAAIALGRRPEPPPGPREASVVLPPGFRLGTSLGYHFAALSPDGRALAYTAREAGSIALRVRRLDSRQDIAISGTDDARDPFFSPDGEWIAFFDGRHLLKVSVHGGAPVPLAVTGQDRGGVWLDDGRIVLSAEATEPLMIMPGAGGTPVAVTTLDSTRKERTHRWPSALRGGPWVVFTVGTMDSPGDYDGADIDAVSVTTRERRHLIHGARRAVWAPPNHLVFDRGGSLYAVTIDPRNPRVTEEPVPILDGVAGVGSSGAAFLDIAREGTMAWLPANQDDSKREIGWFDRSGHWTPTTVPPGEYRQLAISPDGRSALVLVGPGGGAGDLWLVDLASGGMRRLTYSNTGPMSVWFPDGIRFAMSAADSLGVSTIEVRRVDGADARTLVRKGPPITATAVTPQGDAVLFSDYGPADGRIYSVPVSPIAREGNHRATGHAASQLPTDAGNQVAEQAGVLSPDGVWLAYVSNRTGREEVFIRRRDGTGGRWQVSTRGGGGARWGRAGRELFFVEDEMLKRVTVSIHGDELAIGQPQPLFDVPASPIEPTYRDYAYDPTSDRFLFTRAPVDADQQRELALSIGWGSRITELIRKRQEQR